MKQRYSTYKSSGVGEIPSHWTVSKVKYISKIFGRIGYRGYTTEDVVDEGEGVISLSPSNIDKLQKLILENSTYISWEKYHESPEIKVFPEDLILCKTSSIGKVTFIPKHSPELTLNPQLIVLKELKGNYKFLWYFMVTNYFQNLFEINKGGGVIPTISQEKINDFGIVLPPFPEQEQIVKYLDEKTSQIDNLISITEKKIELLKQKRTSLINEVVTKGLNKDVEMKDSGVKWIGQIPEHWYSFSLRRVLRTLTDFESNGSFSSVKENVEVSDEGDVWYVRMTDLENNNLRNEQCKYCDIETYNFLVKTSLLGGELLITKRGEIGKVYLFPENMGKSTLGPNSYLLRFDDRVISRFLYWFYKSDYGQTTLKLLDNSTTIGSLYKDDIKGSPIILPPLSEQEQIVEYIDTHTTEIDKLVSIEQRRIETLKEYRQSLISEVVTGKVRVCEEVTQLQES